MPTPISASRRTGASEHTTADAAKLANDYEVMRHRYEDVMKENESLKAEQRRRMESYMRRETSYQTEIDDMKAMIERQAKERPPEDERLKELRGQHRQVIEVVGALKTREKASLHEQEQDLLRAFRARLWDVQFELESERSKKDDGALEWIEKTKTLGKELDWSRDEALRLDRTNQFLSKDNERLKTQLRAQEGDREFMVRQMLNLKKENARLKMQVAYDDSVEHAISDSGGTSSGSRASSASLHRGASGSGAERPKTANSTPPARHNASRGRMGDDSSTKSLAHSEQIKGLMLQQAESEERHRETVARLKRQLETERRNLRAVRAAHANDLASRNELETLLRACVEDVRKEVASQHSAQSTPSFEAPGHSRPAAAGGLPDVVELGAKERSRVLELLLSQVSNLLLTLMLA